MVSTASKMTESHGPTSHVVVALDLGKNGTPLVVGNDRWATQKIHLLHQALHAPIQVVTGAKEQALVLDGVANVQERAFTEKDIAGRNAYVLTYSIFTVLIG